MGVTRGSPWPALRGNNVYPVPVRGTEVMTSYGDRLPAFISRFRSDGNPTGKGVRARHRQSRGRSTFPAACEVGVEGT